MSYLIILLSLLLIIKIAPRVSEVTKNYLGSPAYRRERRIEKAHKKARKWADKVRYKEKADGSFFIETFESDDWGALWVDTIHNIKACELEDTLKSVKSKRYGRALKSIVI